MAVHAVEWRLRLKRLRRGLWFPSTVKLSQYKRFQLAIPRLFEKRTSTGVATDGRFNFLPRTLRRVSNNLEGAYSILKWRFPIDCSVSASGIQFGRVSCG